MLAFSFEHHSAQVQPQRSISMAVNSSFDMFNMVYLYVYIDVAQCHYYALDFMSIYVKKYSLNHIKYLNILYVKLHIVTISLLNKAVNDHSPEGKDAE